MSENNQNRLSNTFKRDPSKRQIKQTFNHLDLLDDPDDESDDDYKFEEKDSDEDLSNEESGTNASNSSDSSSESDDNSNQSSEVLCQEETVDKTQNHIKVCMVCHDDLNADPEDLMECDRCGIVVHEECYKVPERIFHIAGQEEAPTDLWFCEPCLLDVENPLCELCAYRGGVFKRTDNNAWVHLICSLYTPNVAFNDPDNLMTITLTEIHKEDWSAYKCSLCTEPYFSWTGICISCDAGLCKNKFHVTCALKNGLLAEINFVDNPSDPYFAQCIQHSDKEIVRRRKKVYQSSLKPKKFLQYSEMLPDCRYKFLEFQKNYKNLVLNIDPLYVPSVKVPLFLQNSPVAMRLFAKKSLVLNLPTEKIIGDFSNGVSLENSKSKQSSEFNQHHNLKKIHSLNRPTFTIDFVEYFSSREEKICQVVKNFNELKTKSDQLESDLAESDTVYNAKLKIYQDLKGKDEKMTHDLTALIEMLRSINKQADYTDPVKELLRGPKNGFVTSSNQTRSDEKKEEKCSVCNLVAQDDVKIECDKCELIFHTFCLDPPLKKSPKIRGYVWNCSDCTKSQDNDQSSDELKINLNEPRKSRTVAGLKGRKSTSYEMETKSILGEENEDFPTTYKKARYSHEINRNNQMVDQSISKTVMERLQNCVVVIDDINEGELDSDDDEGQIVHVLREVNRYQKSLPESQKDVLMD